MITTVSREDLESRTAPEGLNKLFILTKLKLSKTIATPIKTHKSVNPVRGVLIMIDLFKVQNPLNPILNCICQFFYHITPYSETLSILTPLLRTVSKMASVPCTMKYTILQPEIVHDLYAKSLNLDNANLNWLLLLFVELRINWKSTFSKGLVITINNLDGMLSMTLDLIF